MIVDETECPMIFNLDNACPIVFDGSPKVFDLHNGWPKTFAACPRVSMDVPWYSMDAQW